MKWIIYELRIWNQVKLWIFAVMNAIFCNCVEKPEKFRVQTPLKSWTFQASPRNCKNCVHNCEDHSFTWFHIRSSYMIHFIYHSTFSFPFLSWWVTLSTTTMRSSNAFIPRPQSSLDPVKTCTLQPCTLLKFSAWSSGWKPWNLFLWSS